MHSIRDQFKICYFSINLFCTKITNKGFKILMDHLNSNFPLLRKFGLVTSYLVFVSSYILGSTVLSDNIIIPLMETITTKHLLEYFDFKHDEYKHITKLRDALENHFMQFEHSDLTKTRTFYRVYKWNKYLLAKLNHKH